jgi:ELWxxDGT repeat protein
MRPRFLLPLSVLISASLLFACQVSSSEAGEPVATSEASSPQAEGPTVIAEVIAQGGGDRDQVAVAGGRLFFVGYDGTHGHELWISDGTADGTGMVKDIYGGDDAKNIRHLTTFGNRVLFLADDGTGRFGSELWISDGTEAGTRMVVDLVEGPRGIPGGHFAFGQLDSRVMLFTSWHDIYRTDGTAGGTRHLARVPGMDNQAIYTAQGMAGKVLFRNRYEIWVSDGTTEGTFKLDNPGQIHGNTLVHQGRFYYGADEPRITDGTPAGTRVVKDLFVGPNESRPSLFQPAGNYVVFAGNEGRFGYEFYVTDGTEAGTKLLKDVTAGVEGSAIDVPDWLLTPHYQGDLAIYLIDRRLYAHDYTLWRSDGTEAGTFPLRGRFRRGGGMGSENRLPYWFVTAKEQTYFLVGDRRPELWSTDGTVEGTKPTGTTLPFAPAWIAPLGDHLYAVIGSQLVMLL